MSWLDPVVTTVALCWRLDRRDGVSLGFTAHDRALTIGGLIYAAAPGMTPSAVSRSDRLEVDTLDIAGALTGDAIAADDLAAGRWDGAALRVFAIDWTDPAARPVPLTRGTLGDVTIRDGAFTAELRGPTAALDAPACEQTSPGCRASLGDERCRVDLAGRSRLARLAAAAAGTLLALDTPEPVPGIYGYGRLEWLEGANGGLVSLVAASAGTAVTLREPPPATAAAGTLVRLTEGCDRTLTTCRDRFANAANFRGEPWLPGNDLLTRYPGA